MTDGWPMVAIATAKLDGTEHALLLMAAEDGREYQEWKKSIIDFGGGTITACAWDAAELPECTASIFIDGDGHLRIRARTFRGAAVTYGFTQELVPSQKWRDLATHRQTVLLVMPQVPAHTRQQPGQVVSFLAEAMADGTAVGGWVTAVAERANRQTLEQAGP